VLDPEHNHDENRQEEKRNRNGNHQIKNSLAARRARIRGS